MFTYEITEDPIIVLIKDPSGGTYLHQPHHPEAENFAPWVDAAEASAWGEQKISELNHALENPTPAPTKEELIAKLEEELAALRAE
jgi:hypothetical protein